MKQKFNSVDFLKISALWFGLAFQWGAILSIFLQRHTLNFVPAEQKGMYYSILAAVGAVIAGVVQIIAGRWSDNTKTKWGKRIPFIFAGIILNTFALLLLGYSNSFVVMLTGIILVQIFANIASAPYYAVIPDMVQKEQQGAASAWMGVFSFVGQAAGPVFAGFIIAKPGGPQDLMIFIAVMLNLLMLYTVYFVREDKTEAVINTDTGSTPFSYKDNRDFTWIFISRFLVNIGFYIALGFLMYYIKDCLRIKEYETYTGILIMTITAAGILASIPAGIIADRYSKKMLILITAGITAIMTFVFVFMGNFTIIAISGFILGVAFGAFSVIDWAFACNYIPEGKGGSYMAFWNLAFVIPQIIAPLIAGYPSDLLNAAYGHGAGYRVALMAAALFIGAGALAIKGVNEKNKDEGMNTP
ncbi:MAG: MFS transporter [Firmicutes bacterium]|nr:MFS transporter [Bacillota bacterium]